MPLTPTSATFATFGAWLKRQTERHDPVGDLARDYTATCSCPACLGRTKRRHSVAGVRTELDNHRTIPAAYEALSRAETEWRQTRSTP